MSIRGLEGLGGLGLGCEWLAGLVWEGLGCVGFVYKIVEMMAASGNNGGGQVHGLLCMGRNRADSNLAIHFDVIGGGRVLGLLCMGQNRAVHFDFFLFFPCRIFLKPRLH